MAVVFQKARMARIRLAKNASGTAFVAKKKALEMQVREPHTIRAAEVRISNELN